MSTRFLYSLSVIKIRFVDRTKLRGRCAAIVDANQGIRNVEKNILFWTNPKPFLMMVPGVIIVAFLATYVFRQFTKANEDRLENRREHLLEVREKYLQQLIQNKNKKSEMKEQDGEGRMGAESNDPDF